MLGRTGDYTREKRFRGGNLLAVFLFYVTGAALAQFFPVDSSLRWGEGLRCLLPLFAALLLTGSVFAPVVVPLGTLFYGYEISASALRFLESGFADGRGVLLAVLAVPLYFIVAVRAMDLAEWRFFR